MKFYVEAPDTFPRTYTLTDTPPPLNTRGRWTGPCYEALAIEYVVHSKMHGSHEKPQPYVVRGVAKGGRLLVQTLVATEYDPKDRWHEIDGEYTTEGYRFKRYALKPFLTIIKLATTAAKTKARVEAKAAKVGERAEKCGVCPCCFGDYVVTTNHDARNRHVSTKMVHHGYERPGHGYIVGDCHGVGFEPFEISCEGTKSLVNRLHGMLNYRREELRQLDIQDEITVDSKVRRNFHTGQVEIERKTLNRGDDGFAQAIESRRKDLLHVIPKIERDIAEFEKKIAEWQSQKWPRK